MPFMLKEGLFMSQTSVQEAGYPEEVFNDIRVLSEEIGIRFAGTKGDSLAAEYVARRFKEIGLTPETTPFFFIGWGLRENARLLVKTAASGEREIVCAPRVYSSSTPRKGVQGRLVYWGKEDMEKVEKYRAFERDKFLFKRYSIVDQTNTILAAIVSRDFPEEAKASPWGALRLPYTTPTVMIGEKDGLWLEATVKSGEKVEAELSVSTEFDPAAVTRNVYAHITGSDLRRNNEQILVMAHGDTQYNSPGAVDDASGVACLIALSKLLQGKRPRRSILFAVLNLDMLCCNEPDWIHASQDFLAQESVRLAAQDTAIIEKYGSYEVVTPPWPSGDQDIFNDAGIPCVAFTWKGYKYPFTHTPGDTIDKVNRRVLSDSFSLACAVVQHIGDIL